MILAYVHRSPTERVAELCLLASKPDRFSVPIPVFATPGTKGGVLLVGPHEAVTVVEDGEWRVFTPVEPSHLFLTPPQPDRPGLIVKKIRVRIEEDESHLTEFQQEKDLQTGQWRKWDPVKMAK
ncbi:MAG: hypothetical protein KDD64_08850 [Bdellovibrionales bacterium]|nr:hypothetical protein [Bdellovibrionales bacterium]